MDKFLNALTNQSIQQDIKAYIVPNLQGDGYKLIPTKVKSNFSDTVLRTVKSYEPHMEDRFKNHVILDNTLYNLSCNSVTSSNTVEYFEMSFDVLYEDEFLPCIMEIKPYNLFLIMKDSPNISNFKFDGEFTLIFTKHGMYILPKGDKYKLYNRANNLAQKGFDLSQKISKLNTVKKKDLIVGNIFLDKDLNKLVYFGTYKVYKDRKLNFFQSDYNHFLYSENVEVYVPLDKFIHKTIPSSLELLLEIHGFNKLDFIYSSYKKLFVGDTVASIFSDGLTISENYILPNINPILFKKDNTANNEFLYNITQAFSYAKFGDIKDEKLFDTFLDVLQDSETINYVYSQASAFAPDIKSFRGKLLECILKYSKSYINDKYLNEFFLVTHEINEPMHLSNDNFNIYTNVFIKLERIIKNLTHCSNVRVAKNDHSDHVSIFNCNISKERAEFGEVSANYDGKTIFDVTSPINNLISNIYKFIFENTTS